MIFRSDRKCGSSKLTPLYFPIIRHNNLMSNFRSILLLERLITKKIDKYFEEYRKFDLKINFPNRCGTIDPWERLRTNGNGGIERCSVSIRASQNDTLSRVNRANEAVWLRQGAPVIFFFDASKRLSDCPSIHPDRRGFVAGIQPLFPLLSLYRSSTKTGKADIAVKREIDVARCLG